MADQCARPRRGSLPDASIEVEGFGRALIAALALGLVNIPEGFRVESFWSGVFGAILFSLVSWALSSLVLRDEVS